MTKQHWLTRAETIRALWVVFAIVLALTVASEFLIAPKPYFDIERVFGFNAWFGLLACAALICIAKLLGAFLKRPDTYYERADG